jgi:hypothetical protein
MFQGRGYHLLPPATTVAVVETMAGSLDAAECSRAFSAAIDVFLTEVEQADAVLAKRLSGPLRELTGV